MAGVIGFSAGSAGRKGNVDRMVEAILRGSGKQTEFVKLTDLVYTGCRGCVQLCARPRRCMLEDDLLPYYEKILEADALVLGAPVSFDSISGNAFSFLERFFGYRHVDIPVSGKPVVLVIAGGMQTGRAAEQARTLLAEFFQTDILDIVELQSGVPPCLKCGRHRECRIGGLYMMLGEKVVDLTISQNMFKRWEDDPRAAAAVERAAARLAAL